MWLGKHFIKHDMERSEAYLDSVAEGKAKISGATLLLHELLTKALGTLNFEYREGKPSKPSLASALHTPFAKREAQVIDAQWDVMIARLHGARMLDNCLTLCDVSGSMGAIYWLYGPGTQPILLALALSMTLVQLAKLPFANIFVTFSSDPVLVTIQEGAGLAANAKAMVDSQWGGDADLHMVFVRLLLPRNGEYGQGCSAKCVA